MRQFLFATLAFLPITLAFADTEPNNTWPTALTLPKDRTVAGTQSDDDWYAINVADGSTRVLIDLTFSDAEGDIQMDFLDSINPGGPLLRARSATATDHEFIENAIVFAGTYYIKVYGADAGNDYTLTWTELAADDDSFEDNDTGLEAAALTDSTVALGRQLDEEWYSIQVTSGSERVLASLRFENTGKLDLYLRDTSGTELASSTNAAVGINETIDFDLTPHGAGTYHLQVAGDDTGDGYALNWAGVAPASSGGFPVPAVNEVPVATANTVSTTENTTYNFSASDFTFSDAEGDSLVSATLSNLSLAGGTLTHSGGTQVDTTFTLTATQLDSLKYTPPADSSGSPLATFDFTVNDIDEGTVAAQMAINVTAVTLPPTGGSSSGALAPAWLLVLMLAGLLGRRRR